MKLTPVGCYTLNAEDIIRFTFYVCLLHSNIAQKIKKYSPVRREINGSKFDIKAEARVDRDHERWVALSVFFVESGAPFKIGQRTYLGEGVTEEQHSRPINGKVLYKNNNENVICMCGTFGPEMVCSDSVMREIFNDEEMVLLYRFSFEMEKARRSLDLNVQPPPEEPVVAMSMSEDSVVPRTTTRASTIYRRPSPMTRLAETSEALYQIGDVQLVPVLGIYAK
ncbi:hypothetical protein Bca52824_012379 [Brassica carinata]|uniref:Uncharacterized protein n=1 Tax=Brassica carinata TaxID=52824 RepID=A0A8X7VXB5_BRACI|nr:hypothetical protein Bca52824_012379 [Brassica carinata]